MVCYEPQHTVPVEFPLDIVCFSPGLPHDGTTLAQRSLGGSETATIELARCWAQMGHHVVCFAPQAQPGTIDGVTWYPIEQYAAYVGAMPHDVTVISRDVSVLQARPQSGLVVLWCHDLAHKRLRPMLAGAFWQLDGVVVQSAFQKRQYQSIFPGLPDDYAVVVGNGLNLTDIDRVGSVRKHVPPALIFGSRPERGLETALRLMQHFWQSGRQDIVLHASTYESFAPGPLAALYQQLLQQAQQMPNVRIHGSLKRADWYRLLASGAALIYPGVPGEFREISCIVSMEALALGLPVVTIGQGAVPETAGPGAIVVGDEQTNVADLSYVPAFAAGCLQAIQDGVAMEPICRAHGRQQTWQAAAERASAWFTAKLLARSNDPWRVRRHAERVGDRGLAA